MPTKLTERQKRVLALLWEDFDVPFHWLEIMSKALPEDIAKPSPRMATENTIFSLVHHGLIDYLLLDPQAPGEPCQAGFKISVGGQVVFGSGSFVTT